MGHVGSHVFGSILVGNDVSDSSLIFGEVSVGGLVLGNVSTVGKVGEMSSVGLDSLGLLDCGMGPIFRPCRSILRCVFVGGHTLRGILLSVLCPVFRPCSSILRNIYHR